MKRAWLTALVAVLLLMLTFPVPAKAHETKSAGPYLIRVGWQYEPAYTGIYQGVEVSVNDTRTRQLVGSLEGNLTVTLSIGPTSVALSVDPSDKTGVYDAHVILTLPGTYTATVKGTIGSTAANLNFVLDMVADSGDIQLPVKQPSATSLQSSINDANNRAIIIGWLGIGLGIAGIAIGTIALIKGQQQVRKAKMPDSS